MLGCMSLANRRGKKVNTLRLNSNYQPHIAHRNPHEHNYLERPGANFAIMNQVNRRWLSRIRSPNKRLNAIPGSILRQRVIKTDRDIVKVFPTLVTRFRKKQRMYEHVALFQWDEDSNTWFVWGDKRSIQGTMRILLYNP